MSSMPGSTVPNPEPRRPALIGKNVTIKGQIFSREDLAIEGQVDGSVELREHRLTVGLSGKVCADVTAHDIVVLGSVDGHIHAAEKIDIRKQARITGDIKAARIEAEDGAYLKVNVDTQGQHSRKL